MARSAGGGSCDVSNVSSSDIPECALSSPLLSSPLLFYSILYYSLLSSSLASSSLLLASPFVHACISFFSPSVDYVFSERAISPSV